MTEGAEKRPRGGKGRVINREAKILAGTVEPLLYEWVRNRARERGQKLSDVLEDCIVALMYLEGELDE